MGTQMERKHAIVIGASMGGLVAARALADHYDEVTVLDRDVLPEQREPRKGVPQGRHAHGLLARGREVLDQLFPGFSDELVADGAVHGDIVDNVLWYNYGCYLRNTSSTLIGLLVSRPMLEERVRRRLCALPNIRLREQCDATDLEFDRARGRVTGVRVQSRAVAESRQETIEADLVVDASGRGSRSPAWLEALGYSKPPEQDITVDISYKTRQYRRRPDHMGGKTAAIIGACAPIWRFGAILAQEGNRWIVTMGGYLGDESPANDAGFIEYARSLPTPEIYNVLHDAEPLSELTPYHFRASLRRRYEQLSRFPEGFLVFGDAICSFNPIYGQGMTVACLESLALRDCLAISADGVARRFFRAASKLIDTPWQIAVGSDLQHPEVQGERPAQVRFLNWYIAKLYQAARHDRVLALTFLQVANLIQPPTTLLNPRIALRVWRGNRAPIETQMASAAQPL
jgi:2-polyprenyl-6-methoxyphenol hydroxylase-like FAD-dependent oxidoreductase